MTVFHHKCWDCDVQWCGDDIACWNCGKGASFPEVAQVWKSSVATNTLVVVEEIEIQDNRAYLSYTVLSSDVLEVGERQNRIAINSFLATYWKTEEVNAIQVRALSSNDL